MIIAVTLLVWLLAAMAFFIWGAWYWIRLGRDYQKEGESQ